MRSRQNKTDYVYYDLERIKEIPLKEVLEDYGVVVDSYGKFKLREEKTPSCKWYPKTNSYYDFGDSSGGNVIELVKRL